MWSWSKSDFIVVISLFWVIVLFAGIATFYDARNDPKSQSGVEHKSGRRSEIILPRGLYQESFRVVFDRETRDLWQKPDQVIEALGPIEGLSVADIGCGEGYFTQRLAGDVGPAGIVYASDIQKEVLDQMVQNLAPDIAGRVIPILGSETGLGIPEPVDLVFLVQVLGEVPNQRRFLKQVMKIMKPSSRLILIDSKHITDPTTGYSRPQNLAKLQKDLSEEGLILTEPPLHFLPKQFFFILRKK